MNVGERKILTDGLTDGRTVIHVELGNISEQRKLEKIIVKYNMNQ